MSIDFSKYEKMRDDGASSLDVGKQIYADGFRGTDFFKTLRAVFVGMSFAEAKKIKILSSGMTLDEWAKPIIQGLEAISKDETDNTES